MSTWHRVRTWSARPQVVAASLVLVLVFSYLMNAPGLGTSGAEFERLAGGPTFDFRFGGYDAEQFRQALVRAGDAGRDVYRRFMWLDLLFPSLYAVFWLGVFERVARRWGGWWRIGPIIPVATALVDYLENAFVAAGVSAFPAPAPTAVALASAATQAKGMMTLTLLACAVAALGRWLVSLFRPR